MRLRLTINPYPYRFSYLNFSLLAEALRDGHIGLWRS